MAAREGFEPSQTESESAVLPLHNLAKRIYYYTYSWGKVNRKMIFFLKKFFARQFSGKNGAPAKFRCKSDKTMIYYIVEVVSSFSKYKKKESDKSC